MTVFAPHSRRKLAKSLLVLFALSFCTPPVFCIDYSKMSTAQLIDELVKINSRSPGIDSAVNYQGFIADDGPGQFQMGILGVAVPNVPLQMRELVRRGPRALPDLIKHLDDRRPTKLEVGSKDPTGNSGHQIGVDFFRFSYFSDGYDPRLRVFFSEEERKRKPWPLEKNFQVRYTVKVGDVCFVLIGQIVNRRLFAVRYQPTGGLVVNSPIVVQALAEKVRNDWGNGDAELLKSSLLADIRGNYIPQSDDYSFYRSETAHSAFERLRLYFPDTYKSLDGDDLNKRREFEKQEATQQSSK